MSFFALFAHLTLDTSDDPVQALDKKSQEGPHGAIGELFFLWLDEKTPDVFRF